LGQSVRAGLEDDEQDSERGSDLLQHEAVGNLRVAQASADGLLHVRQRAHTLRKLRNLPVLQLQPVQKR